MCGSHCRDHKVVRPQGHDRARGFRTCSGANRFRPVTGCAHGKLGLLRVWGGCFVPVLVRNRTTCPHLRAPPWLDRLGPNALGWHLGRLSWWRHTHRVCGEGQFQCVVAAGRCITTRRTWFCCVIALLVSCLHGGRKEWSQDSAPVIDCYEKKATAGG
jgi:hypothetical protein